MRSENEALGFGIFMALSMLFGCWLGAELNRPRSLFRYGPTTDTLVVVDTIYAPPPGWSEAFQLECRWIPEDTTDE